MRERAPFTLRYMTHTNRGLGYTQNQGIRVSKAPIVLLIADDIFLATDAFEVHLSEGAEG